MTPGRQAGVKTGQAARALRIDANTLRAWERRSGIELSSRTPGGHRLYDRSTVVAMHDAMEQGYTGVDVVIRAAELIKTGRYSEPQTLRDRMLALERKIDMLTVVVRRLQESLEQVPSASHAGRSDDPAHQSGDSSERL